MFDISAIVLTTLIAGQEVSQPYSSHAGHYSFRLPTEWEPISQRTFKEMTDVLSPSAPHSRYEAGFKRRVNRGFRCPYILLTNVPMDSPTGAKLQEQLADQELNRALNDTPEWLAKRISEAMRDRLYYDLRRQVLFTNEEIDVQGMGSLKTLTAYCLGRDTIAVFHMHALQQDYTRDLASFNSLLDTFRWEAGFEFVETRPPPPPSTASRVVQLGLIGGAIAGLIALIGLVKRIEYRRQSKRDTD
jgi:hypothetical protein